MATTTLSSKFALDALIGKKNRTRKGQTRQQAFSEQDTVDFELEASEALRIDTLAREQAKRTLNVDSAVDMGIPDAPGSERDDVPSGTLFMKELTGAVPVIDDVVEETGYHKAFIPAFRSPRFDTMGQKSVGVFCDSPNYSALLKHELAPFDLNIQHFHHPKTFDPARFALFDTISAWIICLSEEHEGDFLERFLDRYGDQPTLFVFENSRQDKTASAIARFVDENELASPEESPLFLMEEDALAS